MERAESSSSQLLCASFSCFGRPAFPDNFGLGLVSLVVSYMYIECGEGCMSYVSLFYFWRKKTLRFI